MSRQLIMSADDEIANLRAENNMLKGVIAERPEMRAVVGELRMIKAALDMGNAIPANNRLNAMLRRLDRESQE